MFLNGTGRYPHLWKLNVTVHAHGSGLSNVVFSLLPRSNVRVLHVNLPAWNDEIAAKVAESLLRSASLAEVTVVCETKEVSLSGVVDFVCYTTAGKRVSTIDLYLEGARSDELERIVSSLTDPRATHRLRKIRMSVDAGPSNPLPWSYAANPMHVLTINSLESLRIMIGASALPALTSGTVFEDSFHRRAQAGIPPLHDLFVCMYGGSEANETVAEEIKSLVRELSPATYAKIYVCHGP